MVHLAGVDVFVEGRHIQRCSICGFALINDDLARMAVPAGESDRRPSAWAVGSFVEVTGSNPQQSVLVSDGADGRLPEGCCCSVVGV
jgi:hypothetical protein